MKVLQVLPSLNSGGVERGTVEFAAELVRRGHSSVVMSNGGRLVPELEAAGSRHVHFPVHRKSLASLRYIPALRRELERIAPDIIHLRSRLPAWMVWLAVGRRRSPGGAALVSTFHGLYSRNRYSAIMACGDQVIAISDCVRDYIRDAYPGVDQGKVTVIPRGADTRQFPARRSPDPAWYQAFCASHPLPAGAPVLLMPGRLSQWKGQRSFLELLARLHRRGCEAQGLIAGEPEPGKTAYANALHSQARELGIASAVHFLGHRGDMAPLYQLAAAVYNLSEKPEPFGRTVVEALASTTPVIAWDRGGPAESLRDAYPQGLVPPGDMDALVAATLDTLARQPRPQLPPAYTLAAQSTATLAVYQRALDALAAAA